MAQQSWFWQPTKISAPATTKHRQQVHFKEFFFFSYYVHHCEHEQLYKWEWRCSLICEVKDKASSRLRTENQSNSAHSIRPGSYISPSAANSFIPWLYNIIIHLISTQPIIKTSIEITSPKDQSLLPVSTLFHSSGILWRTQSMLHTILIFTMK